MGSGDLGNVVLSHGFQFTDTETAHADVFDHELVWTPALPKTFQPIKSRWIYAYAFAPGQKAILAAEYQADKDGALTFVPGAKRRLVEPSKAPAGTSVPEAALPIVVQGKPVKYAFVATRGQMGKAAIWNMENSLHPIYERIDLADPSLFHAGPSNQQFVAIIDILTVAEGLHWAYLVARNAAINYVMVHPFNTDNDKVEVQTLKYRLAKIIRDGLWQPPGGQDDPMDLAGYLAGDGSTLTGFMSDYESGLNKLIWAGRNLARDLIRLFNSRLWLSACGWYLDTPDAAKTIGHFCLDVFFRCLDRLGETPEGQAFERQLVHDEQTGLLGFLFVSDEDAESDLFNLWFPVMRKAATAVVIGLYEMAPALIVYGKARAASMEKVISSIQAFLTHTTMTLVREAPRGDFVEIVQTTRTSLRIEINYTQAKADLEGWIEDGKPAWPEESRIGHAGKLVGYLFACVELVNFYNSASELLKEPNARHVTELAGALCDLVAALEDPIKGWAKTKEAQEAAGAELAGDTAADAEAGGSKIFKALAAPEFYKVLGAFSAAIDVWFNANDAIKAYHHGDQGMAAAKGTLAGGSLFIFAGSVINAVGYTEAAAAGAEVSAAVLGMTAAASVLLVAGIAIVIVGSRPGDGVQHLVLAEVRTPHLLRRPAAASPGFEDWSGGNFSEWTETKEGLSTQLQVLTAMLCAFKVSGTFKMSGHGADAESIAVTFGSIPPRSKLELRFEIEYRRRRFLQPVLRRGSPRRSRTPASAGPRPSPTFSRSSGEGVSTASS